MPADAELYLLTKEVSDGGEANFKKKAYNYELMFIKLHNIVRVPVKNQLERGSSKC